MNFKLISCDVFVREVCLCVAESANTIDLEFTEKGSHDNSLELRALVQDKIDKTSHSRRSYDAVLLLLGLCGNALSGILARDIPIVVPRAHDCCTIFLGSKALFRKHFEANPSRGFTSAGYSERDGLSVRASSVTSMLGLDKTYEEYARLYGEENARYICDTLAPARVADDTVAFIDVPETRHLGFEERCRREAERDGRRLVVIPGDLRLVRGLVSGAWNSDEFLVVPPGKQIVPTYDWNEVIRAG